MANIKRFSIGCGCVELLGTGGDADALSSRFENVMNKNNPIQSEEEIREMYTGVLSEGTIEMIIKGVI